MRMPSLFVSHGSPSVVLDGSPAVEAWRRWATQYPKPRAVIVMSSHHPALLPYASTSENRWRSEHDFEGFPAELDAINYAAPGDTALLQQVLHQLEAAGLKARGRIESSLDHGAWIPLQQMFPEADVPVIALSVQPRSDARAHWQLGQALSSLAEQGILLMGSGCVTHNLFDVRWQADQPTAEVEAFRAWLIENLMMADVPSLLDWYERAPHARHNHPSSEHLLPLFFALGAGGDVPAEVVHRGVEHAALAMDMFAFSE